MKEQKARDLNHGWRTPSEADSGCRRVGASGTNDWVHCVAFLVRHSAHKHAVLVSPRLVKVWVGRGGPKRVQSEAEA